MNVEQNSAQAKFHTEPYHLFSFVETISRSLFQGGSAGITDRFMPAADGSVDFYSSKPTSS